MYDYLSTHQEKQLIPRKGTETRERRRAMLGCVETTHPP